MKSITGTHLLFFVSIGFLSFFAEIASSNEYHRPSVIHLDRELNPKQRWYKSSQTEEVAIQRLLEHLENSETGQKLLNKARAKAYESGRELKDLLTSGKSSLLDTTLVRRFTPDRPDRVHYEMTSKIYINKNHTTLNAILDLAHELTHFTFREPFNPYETEFTPAEFVRSTVEGEGGEVEAYLIECKVLEELYPSYTQKMSNCDRVKNDRGKLSKRKGVSEFYKVGEHFRIFKRAAKAMKVAPEKFQNLSREESQFISSAYNLPYPVAAIKEFQVIMGKVCQNDERRISLMQSGREQEEGRQPASKVSLQELVQTHKKRCRAFL